MATVIQIAAFMKRRLKSFRYVPRETLIDFLNWHHSRGSLAYVEENGKVKAAGVARPVNETILGMMEDETKTIRDLAHYTFDDESEETYCDHGAAESPRALALLFAAMHKRFPKTKTILFRRKHGMWSLRKYSFERFMKLNLKQAGLL